MPKPLPFDSSLDRYQMQVEELLAGHRSGDRHALRLIHENHPRFRDENIAWMPRNVSEAELRGTAFDLPDAQLTLSRWYSFRDWEALAEYADAVTSANSPVWQFESGAEAVITGDARALEALLAASPELVLARSTRVTYFDPPQHRATLLHYVAANGVESYRQKTPANAVEIARILLEAGADADALADMYGGECTTMSVLVSSFHPARAGLQAALVDTLVDFGASVEARGSGRWVSPLMTALVFGYKAAAESLVRRGARVDTLSAAAGLGRIEDAKHLLTASTAEDRHRALALAAQHGHAEAVNLLLDAGEDPDRYNPPGCHSHATPLHHAVLGGHDAVVRMLVERGARLDIEDTIYHSTPVGWAKYAGKTDIVKYLQDRSTSQS